MNTSFIFSTRRLAQLQAYGFLQADYTNYIHTLAQYYVVYTYFISYYHLYRLLYFQRTNAIVF